LGEVKKRSGTVNSMDFLEVPGVNLLAIDESGAENLKTWGGSRA